MKAFFILLLVSLLSSFSDMYAQIQAGIHGQLGVPFSQFGDNVNTLGGGLGINVLHTVGSSSFYLGLGVDYLAYGREVKDQSITTNNRTEKYTLKTTNNLVQSHLIARFVGETDLRIRPYLDGLLGFKYLYTKRVLEDSNHEIVDSNTDFDDFAFSYGGAGGVFIDIFREVSINLSLVFLKGSKAKYLKKGSIREDPNDPDKVIFDVSHSQTDMIMPRVGITFFIDK